MLIYYGSFMYFMYILLAIGGFLGAFFALRNRSERTKKLAVVIIASVNLAQHLLKGLIYPHYWGGHYSLHLSSAYNVCAFLIISSPFIWLFGSKLLKNFLIDYSNCKSFSSTKIEKYFFNTKYSSVKQIVEPLTQEKLHYLCFVRYY